MIKEQNLCEFIIGIAGGGKGGYSPRNNEKNIVLWMQKLMFLAKLSIFLACGAYHTTGEYFQIFTYGKLCNFRPRILTKSSIFTSKNSSCTMFPHSKILPLCQCHVNVIIPFLWDGGGVSQRNRTVGMYFWRYFTVIGSFSSQIWNLIFLLNKTRGQWRI